MGWKKKKVLNPTVGARRLVCTYQGINQLFRCCAGATFGSKQPFCATAAARLVARSATRDFERTTFFAAREKNCCGLFFCRRPKTKLDIFLIAVVGEKRISSTFFAIRRRRKRRLIFLFTVVDKNKLAPFAIRHRLLLCFRHFLLLFVVAENKLKGAFRYSLSQLFIGRHVLAEQNN